MTEDAPLDQFVDRILALPASASEPRGEPVGGSGLVERLPSETVFEATFALDVPTASPWSLSLVMAFPVAPWPD